MEQIKIAPLRLPNDSTEINNWQYMFKDDPRFSSIQQFILENNTYYGLGEVIETNYEILPIGQDERKYALSIKHSDKVIGFVLALVHQLQTYNPELILQYLVIRPDYQQQGIGTKVISELIENATKYFDTQISSVFARVDCNNKSMQKTLKQFGFNLPNTNKQYISASLEILENNNG